MKPARARLLGLSLLALACDREPAVERVGARAEPSALAALERPPPAPPPTSSEARRAVADIRERALSLASPPFSFRRLAFGARSIVQLGADRVVVRSSQDGAEIADLPIAAHAAVSLPFGGVLVAGLAASYRFDPGARAPREVARVSLLPGTELHPSRETADHVWVVQPGLGGVLRYALAPDAGFGLERERALPGYDRRAFTTLLDGSFLYTTEDGLARAGAVGAPRKLGLPADIGRAWRLLAGDRIGRAWLATEDGDLVLLELGARSRVVRRISTALRPFDAAATTESVALVSVAESGARTFALSVYDTKGELRFRTPLPAPKPSSDPDWFAQIAAEQQVALAEAPPRVAVGGRTRLLLWDSRTGAQVLAE